jgi:hypothetical protein
MTRKGTRTTGTEEIEPVVVQFRPASDKDAVDFIELCRFLRENNSVSH